MTAPPLASFLGSTFIEPSRKRSASNQKVLQPTEMPMLRPYSRLLGALLFLVMSSVISGPFASEPSSDVPSWLGTQVGDGDGQIERVVLERARALYLRKLRAGAIKNPCYFAMDATRPHDLGDGRLGRRFYAICEFAETFQAFSAGHGGGR